MAICKHCGAEIEEGLDYCPSCGQSNTEDDLFAYGDFFEPDAGLEEESYNIFDAPEEFDLDSLLEKEFSNGTVSDAGIDEADDLSDFILPEAEPEDLSDFVLPEAEPEDLSDFVLPEAEPGDLSDFVLPEAEPEDLSDFVLPEADPEELSEFALPTMDNSDLTALDDLFQDLDSDTEENSFEFVQNSPDAFEGLDGIDSDLIEMLATSAEDTPKKSKKTATAEKTKEKVPFFKRIFGNVPVDESKKKPEPTEEEIAEKKKQKAEEKQKAAEEKKLASEAKKEEKKKNKAEKARLKELAKAEKKAKKLEAAKQILEEVQETRINRVGATIIFLLFAVIGVGLFFGSELFGYNASIKNADRSFQLALDNDVRHYNDAYEQVYGLTVKPEDQELVDKIMLVMFVNKELNSYNSHMKLEDYPAALHDLLKGMYRYGKYYDQAVALNINRDMDFVRSHILHELETVFSISEDEAEVLRNELEDSVLGYLSSADYSKMLYEIVQECGLVEK